MNKHLAILLLLFGTSAFCQAQPTNPAVVSKKHFPLKEQDTIYPLAAMTLKPEFPGGLKAFYKSFYDTFKLPEGHADIKGKMFISFVIEKDGSLSNIKILRDLGTGTGAETIRVIRQMPNWEPGKYHEKVLRCKYTLAINFPYQPSKADEISEIPDKR